MIGTEQTWQDWQLTIELGTSEASESQPFAIGGAQFVQSFDDGLGYRGVEQLQLLAPDRAYQAEGYNIDEVEVSDAYTEENADSLKVDLATTGYNRVTKSRSKAVCVSVARENRS